MAKKKIAIVCTGAVGGYAGAHMVKAGEDVTFIDFWPEHVEHMKAHGLTITHLKDVEPFTVPVRALHVTEAQHLAKEPPIDIAFVCTKSYDTAWAATLIKQYLAPDGYMVSLQNCMNEETIAGVVGWGKTLGSIASSITVGLNEPGHVARAGGKHGSHHTVFRVGEVHGRHTQRAQEVRDLLANADSAVVTENLWGERWSKLVTNVMGNGLSACTGMITRDLVKNDVIRHFSNRLGSEAIRVGQALGYTFDEVSHLDPEMIARSGEGDAEAQRIIDEHRLAEANRPGGGEHRPSMGQDMVKGRRTEIGFLNGFVVQKGKEVGIEAPTNAILTDIVTRVERGELKPDPKHITDLRLN
ncbi:MAG TPA: ketopantoate reductase family protein [Stellaceae bacterium]|nr:ketopantoate reductase family protein [Stellaceae bacterium]